MSVGPGKFNHETHEIHEKVMVLVWSAARMGGKNLAGARRPQGDATGQTRQNYEPPRGRGGVNENQVGNHPVRVSKSFSSWHQDCSHRRAAENAEKVFCVNGFRSDGTGEWEGRWEGLG